MTSKNYAKFAGFLLVAVIVVTILQSDLPEQIFCKKCLLELPGVTAELRKLTEELNWKDKQLGELRRHLDVVSTQLDSAKSMSESETGKLVERIKQLKKLSLEETGKPEKKREPTSVCPEIYSGAEKSYPTFYTGHNMNCTTAPPFESIVSILLYSDNTTELALSLERAARHYANVPVLIASSIRLDSAPNMKWFNAEKNAAATWNKLVELAETPYIWLSRDVNYVSWDVKLPRLVLELEITDAVITAGSTRNTHSFIWSRNCYQAFLNNYRLEYSDHYRISEHSCLYCRYVEGPFMIRKSDFMQHKLLGDFEDSDFLFHDFFLRVTKMEHGTAGISDRRLRPVLVCPDSMAEVHNPQKSPEHKRSADLLKWANKYDIQEIKLPNNDNFETALNCSSIPYNCKNKGRAGYLESPCCMAELNKLLRDTAEVLEELGISYRMDDGSLLGAVKLLGVLPWELDGDFCFNASRANDIVRSKSLREKGYRVSEPEKTGNQHGYIKISSRHWYSEMFPCWYFNITDYSGLTLMRIGDRYIRVSRNPGNEMRNRYGIEIYKHSEHWGVHGHANSWQLYPIGFKACQNPGHHSCLDNFPADGDHIVNRDRML